MKLRIYPLLIKMSLRNRVKSKRIMKLISNLPDSNNNMAISLDILKQPKKGRKDLHIAGKEHS